MRIEGPAAALQALLAAQPVRRLDSPRFEGAAPAAPPPAPAQVSAPVQSVQMLVALAAAAPEAEQRREATRRAADGLDGLTALHRELIAGVVSPQRIEALRAWTRRRDRPEDPGLASLLDDIELRILVELAKRERG